MSRAAFVRWYAPAIATVALVGCAPKPTHLARLTDPEAFEVPMHRTPHAPNIVVRPFVDARQRVYYQASKSTSIPFAFLFHIGGTVHYPDLAGSLGKPRKRHEVMHGDLASDLPELLARSLGGARVGADSCTPGEYIVSGTILETTLDWDHSMALGLFALLGVPTRFAHATYRVRVVVHHRSRPDAPLWSRIYTYDGRRNGGLYKVSPEQPIMRAGLRSVLDGAARDVARVVARAER